MTLFDYFLGLLNISQTHVGKQILTTNDTTQSSVDRVDNANLSTVVESEDIEHFLEFVGCEANDWILDHVRSQV